MAPCGIVGLGVYLPREPIELAELYPAGEAPLDALARIEAVLGGHDSIQNLRAIVSAVRYRTQPEKRNKYVGNILIAIGAILPGIGGTFTRFGHVEVLYVTEFVGLLLIFAGYRANISVPAPIAAPSGAQPAIA